MILSKSVLSASVSTTYKYKIGPKCLKEKIRSILVLFLSLAQNVSTPQIKIKPKAIGVSKGIIWEIKGRLRVGGRRIDIKNKVSSAVGASVERCPPSARLWQGAGEAVSSCGFVTVTCTSELGNVAQRRSRCKGSLSPGSVTWLFQVLLGDREIMQNQPLSTVDLRTWRGGDM